MAKQRMRTRERLRVLENSLQARVRRLRKRSLPILQVAVASGLAYWLAQRLLGHPAPAFAAISVIIVVGVSQGGRISRAVDMSVGGVVGVLIGDLLFLVLQPNPWNISLMIVVAMVAAALLTTSPMVSNQVAIGAVLIATIMPPGGETTGLDRTLDAVLGSLVGLITVAVIPSQALSGVRQEVANVLSLAASVLSDVADGLETRDAQLIDDALQDIRGSQTRVDAMISAAKESRESSTISPLMWGSRKHIRSIERILRPVDNSIRTVRVLARRARTLTADHDTATTQQIAIINELSDIALSLSDIFEAKSDLYQSQEIPELVRRLRIIGGQLDESLVGPKPVLSNYAVLAQTRSLVVDLLQICGMSFDSSMAVLVPTSSTPAVPPEVWHEERWT